MNGTLKTAAALIIGNELLSGKVQEANLKVLASVLRPLGVHLRRVVLVLDDVQEIADEIRTLCSRYDWVFTSGGVGPTHDDVTVEAAARAFSVPVVQDGTLDRLLRDHYKSRYNEAHARMALVPQGATLESGDVARWPVVRFGNCWLLPGIPEIFQMKMSIVVSQLRGGTPFVSESVYTLLEEAELKPVLDAVVRAFPEVEVGSYPQWLHPSYKTKVTFDGTDAGRVAGARRAFIARLPAGEPQSIDDQPGDRPVG